MINYTRTITDEEEKCLLNDIVDIKDWMDKAIEGKINNCLKRAAKQYEQLATKEGLNTVPTTNEGKVAALFAHQDYKNRFERDEAEKLQGE